MPIVTLREGDLDDAIMRLLEMKGASANADLLRELIATVLGLVDDHSDRGDIKILNSAVNELRRSFQVFAPYAAVRKVSVFGSARTPPSHPEYAMARDFARRMADEHGFMVITGAGGGVMLGANEGAGRDRSFGCLIRLPFEPAANEIIEADEKLVTYKYFFTRKLTFVKEADAVALFPGGFGTLDETFEVLTLMQTGKSDILPVVLLDVPGADYWRSFERHVQDQLLRRGLIGEHDQKLYRITEDIGVAVEEIAGFYRNYHSTRYVRERTVIRHLHPIADEDLESMNHEFADILVSGRIERSPALPAEVDQPEIAGLPRLAFAFDRRSYGRLRGLINRLNQAVPATPSPR